MITRFFKRRLKKIAPAKRSVASSKKSTPRKPKGIMQQSKKVLTAEGWKRLMIKKTGKKK